MPNTVMDQIKNVDLEDNKREWKQLFNPYQLDSNSNPYKILGYKYKIHKFLKNVKILKALEWYDKVRTEELNTFLQSDLFDKNAYSEDKPLRESYEDEIWEAIH